MPKLGELLFGNKEPMEFPKGFSVNNGKMNYDPDPNNDGIGMVYSLTRISANIYRIKNGKILGGIDTIDYQSFVNKIISTRNKLIRLLPDVYKNDQVGITISIKRVMENGIIDVYHGKLNDAIIDYLMKQSPDGEYENMMEV